jgi:L-fuconolactonase
MAEPLVDGHLHLWDPVRLRYRWLDDAPLLNRAYLPADVAAASAGLALEQLVFVQCDCDPGQALEEAHWVTELARATPRIAAIVAHAPVERGEAVRPFLEALASLPLVRGVRRLIQGEADVAFCARPEFIAGVAELARYGMSFDLCIRKEQLPAVRELVARCPQVTFVLDHCAKPGIRARELEPWKGDLRALSRLPNVSCKISGLVTEAAPESWQADDLKPYIDHAIACFGPERCMFGGDWPVVLLAATYQRWTETFLAAIANLGPEQRRQLCSATARRVYRLS